MITKKQALSIIKKLNETEVDTEIVDLVDIKDIVNMGLDNVLVLSRMYGGEFIYIPTEQKLIKQIKDEYIKHCAEKMQKKGYSISNMARTLHVTQLRIKKALGVA